MRPRISIRSLVRPSVLLLLNSVKNGCLGGRSNEDERQGERRGFLKKIKKEKVARGRIVDPRGLVLIFLLHLLYLLHLLHLLHLLLSLLSLFLSLLPFHLLLLVKPDYLYASLPGLCSFWFVMNLSKW